VHFFDLAEYLLQKNALDSQNAYHTGLSDNKPIKVAEQQNFLVAATLTPP
jgi:hypothetical protein